MALFRKNDDLYDSYDSDGNEIQSIDKKIISSLKHSFYILKVAFNKIINKVGIKINNKDAVEHYDQGSDDDKELSPVTKKLAVINIVFIAYGLFGGIFMQEYCEYICRKFAAFAQGLNIASQYVSTSPVTVVYNAVAIFFCYLIMAVIAGCMFIGCKVFIFKGVNEAEYLEDLQVAFMYTILCLVLTGIICYALPWNIFYSVDKTGLVTV